MKSDERVAASATPSTNTRRRRCRRRVARRSRRRCSPRCSTACKGPTARAPFAATPPPTADCSDRDAPAARRQSRRRRPAAAAGAAPPRPRRPKRTRRPRTIASDGRFRRSLIRATFPKLEGQTPTPRALPEFTIQTLNNRAATTAASVTPAARASSAAPASGGRRQPGQPSARCGSAITARRRARVTGAGPTAGPGAGRRTPPARRQEEPLMADFTGKVGLIVGVANHRSLAWAIAQATAKAGASSSSPIRAASKSTSANWPTR